MIISEVRLFKTPLSQDYKNVIDTVNFSGDKKGLVFDTLKNNYQMIEVDPISKTLKRINSITSLTVIGIYENIRDYNYCVITDDTQKCYFYFIVGVNSENDNSTRPASSILLKWDAWTNNLDKFNNIPQNVILSHFDRFDKNYNFNNENEGVTPKFYFNSINVDIDGGYREHYLKRYIPAFFKITFKEMATIPLQANEPQISNGLDFIMNYSIDGSTQAGRRTIICDSVNNSFNVKTVYVFAGMFDNRSQSFISTRISGKELRITGGYKYYPIYQSLDFGFVPEQIALTFPDVIYSYISNITLSFNSPFKYTVSSSGDTIHFDNNPIVVLPYNASTYIEGQWVPYAIVGDIAVAKQDNDFEVLRYGIDEDKKETYEFNRSEFLDYYDIYTEGSRFSSLSNIDFIDPINFIPPFRSLYLIYNTKTIPLSRLGLKDEPFRVDIDLSKKQPQLSIFNGSNRIHSPTNLFVENSGYFSFGVDSMDSYMIKNGPSTKLSILNSTIKSAQGIIGVIAGNYFSAKDIIDGASELIATNAKLMGIERTPDEWFVENGESDFKYQDRVRLVSKISDVTNPQYNAYFNAIYLYGYEFRTSKSPFSNNRKSFDFCRTSNCDLSALMLNDNDRKELEDAFNRGLTKWHILTANDTTYFADTMIKNKTAYRNYELKFTLDSDLRQWIGGDF